MSFSKRTESPSVPQIGSRQYRHRALVRLHYALFCCVASVINSRLSKTTKFTNREVLEVYVDGQRCDRKRVTHGKRARRAAALVLRIATPVSLATISPSSTAALAGTRAAAAR